MQDERTLIGENEKIYIEILDVMRNEAGQLSRLAITLSSGSIVLSATLLRDISSGHHPLFLTLSWSVLLICMILAAYIIHFVPKFYYQFLGLLWQDRSSEKYGEIVRANRELAEKLARKYARIKFFMLSSLFLGMSFLVAFAVMNIWDP